MFACPAVLVELVRGVARVEHCECDDWLVTVVVDPVSDSCRYCEDIAISELVHSLVLVSCSLSSAFLLARLALLE